jgi:hypothetical protein
VPFTHLMVDGERINPRLFSATAPQANLSVHADLRPVAPAAAPRVSASRPCFCPCFSFCICFSATGQRRGPRSPRQTRPRR